MTNVHVFLLATLIGSMLVGYVGYEAGRRNSNVSGFPVLFSVIILGFMGMLTSGFVFILLKEYLV